MLYWQNENNFAGCILEWRYGKVCLDEKMLNEAYDKSGKPCPYTEILCVSQPSQSRFFLAAVFSADFDDAFTQLYSFMAVEIKGKHLKEVRQAVQNGRCGFIHEYNENEFLPPAKNAPVIESIRFIAGEKLEDILTSRKR